MTTLYQGPRWILPIVDRFDIPWFDRVTAVSFEGVKGTDQFLRHVNRLRHLRQLVLHETDISKQFVTELRREHPDWKIFHTQNGLQIDTICDVACDN